MYVYIPIILYDQLAAWLHLTRLEYQYSIKSYTEYTLYIILINKMSNKANVNSTCQTNLTQC